MARLYERTLWAWFNKRSMLHMQVVKLGGALARPWMLVRGKKGYHGYRETQFVTLGDLIAGLHEPELESLIEKLDVPAMELIAMAADDGEAA